MVQFHSLDHDQKTVILSTARKWMSEHKEHVQKLIKSESNFVTPSGSDLYRPELWKGIHWRWYISHVSTVDLT